ncbi:MAG: hypothetical protein U0R52_06165 [Solirubrobacterales bacterium]
MRSTDTAESLDRQIDHHLAEAHAALVRALRVMELAEDSERTGAIGATFAALAFAQD